MTEPREARPAKPGVWELIRSDFDRYRSATGGGSALGIVFLCQGFWASLVYRLAHDVHVSGLPSILRGPLRLFFLLLSKNIEILTGICIPAECEIGRGLYIGHFGPLILHPSVRLGSHCNLSQSVTLGWKHGSEGRGAPRLGDRVYVGPGAIAVGGIDIGDDAALGAGAVVLKDVPPRGVVGGNPARLISRKGSFEMIRYSNLEQDPARAAALEEAASEAVAVDSDP